MGLSNSTGPVPPREWHHHTPLLRGKFRSGKECKQSEKLCQYFLQIFLISVSWGLLQTPISEDTIALSLKIQQQRRPQKEGSRTSFIIQEM